MKATKNFIALITNFMLIIVMCSQMMVFAADIDNIEWTLRYGGDCGKSSQSVKWQYHTHNQSVSDKYYNNRFTLTAGYGQDGGVMENYVYKNYDFYSQFLSSGTRKWNSLTTSMYMINIEEGMKVIGDHAFNFCIYANGISPSIIPYAEDTSSNVHYISLPSTLEEIGFLGFAGALKYVDTLTLPANLSTLDYGSFCSNGFKTVVIEEGNLTTLPSYCFANCTSLEEIYIPKTVKKIDSSAFMGCTSLKKIHYGGYSEDWENVTISGDNDALLSAQVMFPIRVHVSSVTLNTTSKTLMAGNTYTLVATVLPSNADITDVEWTSSKPNVATVSSDGIVTAVSAGTTTITATSVEGGIKANCTISVQAANIAVTGISLNKTSTTMNIGATETLTATVSPSNATNKSVTWKSSNTNVASVTNGIITAKATGTATITATTVDGSKSAECIIVVKERKPSSGGSTSPDDEEEPSGELTLTRGSMCAKIVEAFGFELTEQVEESPFSDIDETDEYYEEILICNQLEIVSGYEDGTFKPNGSITNAEVAKLIYSTLSYIGWSVEIPEDADYDKTMWYGQYAWLVEDLGIMIDIDNWVDVANEESITSMLGSIGYVYQKRISETSEVNQYVLEVGNYIALKDNEEIECNCAPILNEGTIFASIRSFADILNLAVEYNGETKEVTFIGWEKILKYTVGDENCIVINGATYVNAELIFTEFIGENYDITADEEKLIATKKAEIEEKIYINVGNATNRKGQEISIPISISNNTGLTGLQFECNYDDVLTLTNVEVGTALNGLNFTTPGDLTANPVTLLWDGIEADKSNGEILILTFKVDDNAEIGDYDILMTVKSAIDQDLNDVDLKIMGGTISIVEYIPGDVDGNGEVNSRDIVLTRRFVAGGYGASILEVAADVDASGDVNSRDIVLMRRYIAGGYGVVLK